MTVNTTTDRLCVQLTASDEWPESDDAHREAVEARLREIYPTANLEVTIGEVSSMRVTGACFDADLTQTVREVSERVWSDLCAYPDAYGL